MASFIHIADSRDVGAIRRSGLRVARHRGPERCVFCVPVLPDYSTTFQWGRELRHRSIGDLCAVQFRIKDHEMVRVGHYSGPHKQMTAAEAVREFLIATDPRGLEVRIDRKIKRGEIIGVRPVNRLTGWRHYPGANGKEPYFAVPGAYNSKALRRSLEQRSLSPWDALPVWETELSEH